MKRGELVMLPPLPMSRERLGRRLAALDERGVRLPDGRPDRFLFHFYRAMYHPLLMICSNLPAVSVGQSLHSKIAQPVSIQRVASFVVPSR